MAGAPEGGPAVLVGLGLGHLAVAGWNFDRELQELTLDTGPIVAAALVGTVSLLVCAVGYRLWHSEFAPRERWRIALGTTGGSVLVGGIIAVSVLVRLLEGRTVAEPVFVLSLASSLGALAGSAVAILHARAKREAAAARRRRDQIEFVTGILRHDVLNSMTVVRSRAEMIANGRADSDREFAETIADRSEKVIDLSERVKDVVAVMASDETLERKPVELAPIVASQRSAIRPDSDDVTVETDVDSVAVVADELLAEVVGNLLENALTHGVDGGGTVSVSTTSTDGRVQLRVADTGPGVPDERKRAIFERGTSSSGGGFGLFFVRTMVRDYGGDIWVEDRADGRSGAVFVVELDRA